MKIATAIDDPGADDPPRVAAGEVADSVKERETW